MASEDDLNISSNTVEDSTEDKKKDRKKKKKEKEKTRTAASAVSLFDVEGKLLKSDEEKKAFQELRARIQPYMRLDEDAGDDEEAQAAAIREANEKASRHERATLILDQRDKRFLHDVTFYRYLKARDFDVDKAEDMLWNTLHWRRSYLPDQLDSRHIGREAQDGKMYLSPARDDQGRPIIYMKPRYDTTNPKEDRIPKVQFLVYIMEEAIRTMDEAVTGIHQVNIVIDFRGQGMSGADSIKVSLDCLHILMDHYPERLGCAWMLNTSFVFSIFWKVISPWLAASTAAKIHFIGKAYDKMAENISSENLESDYGGSFSYSFDFEEWKKTHA